MISDKLKQLLRLEETIKQVGESFMYNVPVYESKLPEWRQRVAYFAECDSNGKPTEGIGIIYCFTRMCCIPLCIEAIEAMSADEIIWMVNREIEKVRRRDAAGI